MERLRAAIEQARKARTRSTHAADHPGRNGAAEAVAGSTRARSDTLAGPESESATTDVVARWAALTPVSLKPSRLRRNRIVFDEKDHDRAAYDMLRTRLLTIIQKEGWRRVAVTSPTQGCGKSTTCLNLAMTMSRHSDIPTILFEADMRRPSMARMLGETGKDSFFDVLQGKAQFADQAVRIGDNVAISLNHAIARDPAELLHRQRTGAVLDMIQEAYEPGLVLFDLPPMMNNDDTLGFIKNVDCVVLIARAETTTADEIDQCERELASHTNVAGVVLNRCRFGLQQYSAGYTRY